MNDTSFYRRPLPETCVAFSSVRGRKMFAEALSEGNMEVFFSLVEQFTTQAEPAFCGLGTLVMVLNALAVDPKRVWKGVWRWYDEELLDCCKPLDKIKEEGISFDEFACLAKCNALEVVTACRADEDEFSEDAFRADVIRSVREPAGSALVIAYDRSGLGQTGTGHFSPIGGYHASSDSVLILDVARFKHPPHWAPLPLVAAAMACSLDPATARPRGWMVLAKSSSDAPLASLCRVKSSSQLVGVLADLADLIPTFSQHCSSSCSIHDAIASAATLETRLWSALGVAAAPPDPTVPGARALADYCRELASAIADLPIFALAADALPATSLDSSTSHPGLFTLTPAHIFVLVLLAFPRNCPLRAQATSAISTSPSAVLDAIDAITPADMPPVLRHELDALSTKLTSFCELDGTSPASACAGRCSASTAASCN
ncbi:phytochelatin synthase family protein [Thecamonas trahens ATCC 50062]|uniref:glutathione gamma-glutamylcysteinyltransferase n=1 Tax=Thecamonas trahens ATCC 50062 TaxID=461836 RepID=A0A0L0DL80_THETB|nr:phytochelatin synthase family protein [Thecamonas trahens ATCC 50062]KNC52791.1 phytochelatin synthase family protein [Thecamonas trahens ATCC 50062]|eukprot:XP_013755101.1 phytochelatin synthase family protein [Thecamonas trahens ATCC 50062]